jgi:hypothetical protein
MNKINFLIEIEVNYGMITADFIKLNNEIYLKIQKAKVQISKNIIFVIYPM